MRISHTLVRVALLGSTIAAAALTQAAAGNVSRADWERIRAATGRLTAAPVANIASAYTAAGRPRFNYTVLHDFAGPPGDGGGSGAEVTLDKSGNIYGTTDFGGTASSGTIFKLAGGTETLLHSFGGTGDGTEPDGAVTILSNGDMIGTTEEGGTTGNGIIYDLAANGTYTVLHTFAPDEGNSSRGRLIQDKRGNFYGTALFGGTPGYGTVFKFSTKGKLSILHAFNNTDGEYPEHGVVSDKSGNLYGVTAFGGTAGEGSVYEISKDGTFTSLYSFTGGSDGGFLYGGLAIDNAGNLYGSTVDGGANSAGTVFKLSPSGTLITLYNFTGGADGGGPEGDMLLMGKTLYSTATTGGDPTCQCGGIYQMSLKGKEKLLQTFTETGGYGYSAGLTASKKTFYGTTAGGGTSGYGVVFDLAKK
ncbi:MAG TPA: choice-of-anchor tandem repeat GloVer-containing protein [Rhizomicrobium sp.]|jgi:uncharacterized repeat protein (TIGR03803 family)